MTDETTKESNASARINQLNHLNFIDLRLNTQQLIKDFEAFLSAKRLYIKQQEDGSFYEFEKVIGEPLANQEGITALLNMLLLRAHHHCIQGNFDEEHYYYNLCKTRKEITAHIIENCYNWGIQDDKLNYLIDTIMDFLEKVMSRLVNNEERKSYMQQFQSKEIISETNKGRNPLASFTGGAQQNA